VPDYWTGRKTPGKLTDPRRMFKLAMWAGKVEEYVPTLVLERTGLMLSEAAALF
jgi:hypothetical protein